MNNSALTEKRTKQLFDNQPITDFSDSTNNKNKPKFLFGIIVLLISIITGYYIIDSLIKPKTVALPIDEGKLNELVDKVVKGVPLPAVEWSEHCNLLAKVKGLNINDCDSCHDKKIF